MRLKVLNVNQLTKTLKPVILPGQNLQIMIMKEKKEPLQGIGYPGNGTRGWWIKLKNCGGKMDVVVTSVLQPTTDTMIFAKKQR